MLQTFDTLVMQNQSFVMSPACNVIKLRIYLSFRPTGEIT